MTYTPELREPTALDQYLTEIGQTPLLSADEELRLARLMRAGGEAAQALVRAVAYSPGELASLAQSYADGTQAREQFIQANLRLVVSIAKPYRTKTTIPLMDLIGHGNEGLIRAVAKFDHTKGHKFSTYATWWIRQSISRAICDYGRAIRLPVHMVERRTRIRQWLRAVEGTTTHEPTPADIARALDLSEAQVLTALNPPDASHSLNYQLAEDDNDGRELGEMIGADEPPIDEQAAAALLSEQIDAVLARLPERTRYILTLRYGLDGNECHTLEAVGRRIGLTRERTRQIEAEALRMLKHPAFGGSLRGWLK